MSESVIIAIVSAASGLLGAAIGLCGALAVAKRTAQAEEHRHFRSLGIEIAKAKFEQQSALAKQLASMKGEPVFIQPYEAFIVYGIRLMDIVTDLSLTPDQIKSRIDVLAKSVSRELPK